MSEFEYHGGGVLSKVRRGDGRRVYYIRYMRRGRRITEKVGLTEKRARGRIESRREQLEDPAYIPEPIKREREAAKIQRIKFRRFCEIYLRDWAGKDRAEDRWFKYSVARLGKAFGSLYLKEITQHRIQRHLAGRKVGPVTRNHALRFIKNMLTRAVDWGYLDESPAAGMKYIHEPDRPEVFLDQKQAEKLVEACAEHLRPIVQAALLTGMRQGELLQLRWSDVNSGNRTIWVPGRKKGAKGRHVPINADLANLLAVIPRHTSHDHVFTYRGKPIQRIKRSWEDARAAAELPGLRFHDLRHTWASWQVEAGVDLYMLMQVGGWRSFAMVQRYAHFDRRRFVDVAQNTNGKVGQIRVAT